MQPQKQDLELMLPPSAEEAAPAPGPNPLDWVMLVLAGAARRKLIALIVFAVGVSATTAFYKSKSPLYRAETTLLAQRQLALPSIVQRSVIDQDPTQAAWEIVHRRENLINVIRQANLPVARFQGSGEPNLSLRLLNPWKNVGAEDDPLSRAALLLDKLLVVMTQENTITFQLDWPNPEEAYELVNAAQQNFLEARHVQEITALGEVIAMLEQRAATLREQLETTIAEVERDASRQAASAPRPSSTPRPASGGSNEELVRLRSALEAKERAIRDLEDLRRRRLSDMQAQLEQLRTVYSEEFPAVVSARKEITSLSAESPQLAALRAEEVQLRRDYNAKLAELRRTQPSTVEPAVASAARTARPVEGTDVDDDERVREARARYQQMLERLTAAHVDFDTASAAYKHRYKVLWPAQLPTRPVSPNPVKIFGAGVLASLFLALCLAAFPDLRAGRILTRWQLERGHSLPVLATFRLRPQRR